MARDEQSFDIAVVGSGLVGMTIARCYALCGLSVALIERQPIVSAGACGVPISLRSKNATFLQQIGLLNIGKVRKHAITQLQISSRGAFGSCVIEKDDKPLAWVVMSNSLAQSMQVAVCEDSAISIFRPCEIERIEQDDRVVVLSNNKQIWRVKRCILAEGGRSNLADHIGLKTTRYATPFDSMITAINTDNWSDSLGFIRHDGHAIYGGIPWRHNQGWVIRTQPVIQAAQDRHGAQLEAAELNAVLGTRLGKITGCMGKGSRASMLQVRALAQTDRIICLGNTALQTPPIGAQGLNMALQDCQEIFRLQQQAIPDDDCQVWAYYLQRMHARRVKWYEKMSQVLDHLVSDGKFTNIRNQLAWSLIGVEQGLQREIYHLGQGAV